jgi:hypothetical protein
MMEQREKKTEGKIPKPISEIMLTHLQKALQAIAYWCMPNEE